MTDALGLFSPPLATTVSVGFVAAAVVNNKFIGHCGPWSPTGQPQDTAFLTATDTGQPEGQPPSEALITPPGAGATTGQTV